MSDLNLILRRLQRRDWLMLLALVASLGMNWAITTQTTPGTVIPGWYVPD